ncbi:CynX/NimT family MFS transporter [Burkholderia pyrrocinia]|uniref:MFS transporter n=1 Tax=Burkholderia pyrrocinia TaxID=60550 RepID=UPI00064BF5E2|nr:MFS transporter [Burkholderia pyrrocinia]AKM04734.1 MFS transporter [Burkholderia pyrrocinia]
MSESPDTRKAAAAIALLILSIALRPPIVSIGPVLESIQQSFGLSYTQASLLTAIPDVCMGVFALAAPGVARRLGTDNAVVAALALLGVAMVARALAGSAGVLLLCTVFTGIGIAISGSLIGGWVKKHFARDATFFMGIYSAGLSVGATVAASASGYIALHFGGWRVAVALWSVLCITAILSWRGLARRFQDAKAAEAQPRQAVQAPSAVGLPWGNIHAWRVAAYFGASQFIVYACFAWLASSSAELHIETLSPGLVLGLFTCVFALSSFGMGMKAGRSTDRRGRLGLASAITAVGIGGLAFAPTAYPVSCIVLIAIGQGMCFTLAMTLPLDHTHSPAETNAWSVFMLFIGYLVAALGPLAFGYLRDRTEGYFASYFMLFLVATGITLMVPLLRPTSAPKDEAFPAVSESP